MALGTEKNAPATKRLAAYVPFRDYEAKATFPEHPLPDAAWLNRMLQLKSGASIGDLLQPALVEPVQYLLDRPGKNIRGKLVNLAFALVHGNREPSPLEQERCRLGGEIVELIHLGSLIVDDIEDGSELRRSQPTLNHRFGLPIALNAGNWLYFWPLRILGEMRLSAEKELSICKLYQTTLVRAHFGQALDLGVLVDTLPKKRIPEVCLASMELKTGALVAFSMLMGGILGGVSAAMLGALDRFGQGFGVALQMFDDLGNLSGRKDPSKRFEDLAFRRPGWVWASAARNGSRQAFDQFVTAVHRLPEEEPLVEWLDRHAFMERAREQAVAYLDQVKRELVSDLADENAESEALKQLLDLGTKVANSYD